MAPGLVIATPLELGLLAVGARETATFPRRRFSLEVLAHVRRLETICERHGVSLAAAALQYVVQHPAVSAVIAGARNPQEARANAAAMQEPIPAAFWDELRATAPPLGGRRAPPAPGGLAAGRISFIQYVPPPRQQRIVPPRDKIASFLHIG